MADAIERISLTHLQVPFKEPYRISGGEVAIKDAILVCIETAEGRVGMGESSPMTASLGYSADTLEGCWDDLVKRIAPGILGAVIEDEAELARLTTLWPSCSRFAVAGVETACWDLLARGRRMSLAEALGAPVEQIAMGVESGLAVGLYPTVIELLQVIERHLAEGYRRVKIKIAPGRDLDLVHAVRQHFGDLPLMVDANAAYTRADLDIFRRLDEYQLLMFEQPMAADDLDGLAELQAAVTTPVCLGETADTLERALEAVARKAGRIINLKIQRMGGFGPALALHNRCLNEGIDCWIGTMPELGVGQAQGIHLSALENCKYPTDVEPSIRWFVDDYVVPLIEFVNPGLLIVPTRSGLGYQVDPVKVRRYQVRHQEFHHG